MGNTQSRRLLSGNEAVAHAALAAHIDLGIGYPGTPSTEILENFSDLGGNARWSPNEKVALEVAVGVAYAKGRAMATMKHVGLNVAADPLFTAAYTGVQGALVVIVADDPGMASSQNEQDSRRYAIAAGIPMLEPSDSQEAFDLLFDAVKLSERWQIPVLYRLSTRICHSKTVVELGGSLERKNEIHFDRDIRSRVMVPAYARPAHKRLRQKLKEIQAWAETSDLVRISKNGQDLGVISSGISAAHAKEAAPHASQLHLKITFPLPLEKMRDFCHSVDRCMVVEEGDPVVEEGCLIAGIPVEKKSEVYRFGELDVGRVKSMLSGEPSKEKSGPPGKPPQLCPGCPHRTAFSILHDQECIVTGDIGCYTLGVMQPFEAIDTCVCMGASIGVGLGLRHVLPDEQARKVVSVIGDSTFVHSGLTGLVEMVYNRPKTGHLVMILDNSTTAMTGLQEHPATGRTLDHQATHKLNLEDVTRAIGIDKVAVLDPHKDKKLFEETVISFLQSEELCVIIARRPCLLAAKKIKVYEAQVQCPNDETKGN
ncbi:thiamine pyrophosphate-binding protein [candidate division KSB1 bacterium]|nr:thiamine pyrophosphate-binding protein [candidate division KSB1 bacterium]